jgi:succinoglycan biosynthesis protein ExoM
MTSNRPATASILIGIPSFRRPDGLKRLLLSLAKQENVGDLNVRIFVAESDAAKQEAVALCREGVPQLPWPLTCGVAEEPGVSSARNAILAQARALNVDLVAMLDDDEVADPNWLADIVTVQQQTQADVVGAPVVFELAADAPAAIRNCGYFGSTADRKGRKALLFGTGNVLLSCAALAKHDWPMFDQRFALGGGGDTEYFMRLRSQGLSFAWAESAIARDFVSDERQRPAQILRRAYRFGNSQIHVLSTRSETRALATSLVKAIVILAASPALIVMMLLPSRRLWAPAKILNAVGRVSAILGYGISYYGASGTR